jgi:cytochrome P450
MDAPRFDVDFTDNALVADPFPVLEEIRRTGRVVWNDAAKVWMLSAYDDCAAMLTDTKGVRFSVPGAVSPDAFFWLEAPALINTEGPDHRRLRRGLAPHFTAAAMRARWEPRVREVVADTLAPAVDGRDHLELKEFNRIPVVVVAELLGVPDERHDDFRRWSDVIIRNLGYGNEGPEARRAMEAVVAEANAYLNEEIERHRRDRPDDLLTAMVDLPDWTAAEIRSVALSLLIAGYETTAKSIGLALVALESHPEQRRLVADEPALLPNAMEEVRRWLGPAQAVPRVVVEEVELAGRRFAPGETIYALLGAANRDATRWPHPERFDVLREVKPNVGFGLGAHVCIGAWLARLEINAAVEALITAVPQYRLRDIDYGSSFFARGPERGIIDISVAAPA